MAQIRKIAETKLKDTNAADIDAAAQMVREALPRHGLAVEC